MKKLTKWLAAALAVLMLAAMLTACGGGGGSSAEIDGPGVSNATTKDLEAAWLAHYNNDLFPDEPAKQNTLQKQAEDFLRNALAHMDPETRVAEQQYVKGYVGVNGSGKTIRAEVKVEEQVSGNTFLIAAYTKEQMKEEISSAIFGRMSKVGFAVLEYDGLYYWAYAFVLD